MLTKRILIACTGRIALIGGVTHVEIRYSESITALKTKNDVSTYPTEEVVLTQLYDDGKSWSRLTYFETWEMCDMSVEQMIDYARDWLIKHEYITQSDELVKSNIF